MEIMENTNTSPYINGSMFAYEIKKESRIKHPIKSFFGNLFIPLYQPETVEAYHTTGNVICYNLDTTWSVKIIMGFTIDNMPIVEIKSLYGDTILCVFPRGKEADPEKNLGYN